MGEMYYMLYLFSMIHVQVNEFKADLAKYGELAASGETVVVTRYNKPFFKITPTNEENHPHLHKATRPFKGFGPPIITSMTLDEMLAGLREDRGRDLP